MSVLDRRRPALPFFPSQEAPEAEPCFSFQLLRPGSRRKASGLEADFQRRRVERQRKGSQGIAQHLPTLSERFSEELPPGREGGKIPVRGQINAHQGGIYPGNGAKRFRRYGPKDLYRAHEF